MNVAHFYKLQKTIKIHLQPPGIFAACGRKDPSFWVPHGHRDLVTCKRCLKWLVKHYG